MLVNISICASEAGVFAVVTLAHGVSMCFWGALQSLVRNVSVFLLPYGVVMDCNCGLIAVHHLVRGFSVLLMPLASTISRPPITWVVPTGRAK